MKTFISFCILLVTCIQHKKSLTVNPDFTNIEPRKFLGKYTWFDIKDYYNKAKAEGNQVEAKNSEDSLWKLQAFRKKYIKKFLKLSANDECKWKKRLPTKYQLKFKNILKLFLGNTLYMNCKTYVYIFNYFGSETATSDLDFGMYRIIKDTPELTYSDELENIQKVNVIIERGINMFLYYLDRTGFSMQQLLDMNGYPDMFVIYDRFFRYHDAQEVVNNGDSNLMNTFSAPLLRICFTSNIYLYMSHLHVINLDPQIGVMMSEMIYDCIKKVMNILAVNTQEIEESLLKGIPIRRMGKEGAEPIEPVEPNRIIDYEYLKSDYFAQKLYQNFENMFEMYSINKYKNPNSFNDCIENIRDIDFFMKFLDVGDGQPESRKVALFSLSNPNRKQLTTKETSFNIYSDIFYVETNDIDIEHSINNIGINRLYMTFLASCFTFADEAYSTIGPLEYVKFKNQIEEGDTPISCLALIENISANFNMILIHMTEGEIKFEDEARKFQSISDALSKYLLRALSNLYTPCRNIYGETLTSPIISYTSLSHILRALNLHNFYLGIRNVDQKDLNKKSIFFQIYQNFVDVRTVREIYLEVMRYYITVSKLMLNSINPYIFAMLDDGYVDNLHDLVI
jgi:hypothetical protein